ncbi:surface-adhesin E family protein [Acinetobacter zhairhuonensis]|uniref:surface-adhesin E family protein n=1 Tax=Acinetobacter sp. A7.4 TaxID=2919921 RepID=UPI001F4E6653|nr:surface-adhesin E family protein [Acinetobacter sp. A7.4]MCJ8160808.1 hypothetical protein [Acinetobacter sp. A7.4]
MLNRVLMSFLSLFWSVFASADWTFVNANYDRSQFIYVDFNRVKVLDAKSNEVEYWVKYLIKNDKEKDGLELGDYSLALYRVGCDSEQYSIRSSANFKKNGSLMSSQNYAASQTRPIIPNTAVDYTAEMVCRVLPQNQKVDRLEQLTRRIEMGEY